MAISQMPAGFATTASRQHAEPLLQRLADPAIERAGVALSVLRLERCHPLAPGNKLFKLKPNLEAALAAGARRVASFGGTWSNHIHALAALGREYGLQTLGFIRGQEQSSTAMLDDARSWGMELHFLSRSDYRRRHEPEFQAKLAESAGAVVIPEGGSNAIGAAGCGDIVGLLDTTTGYDVTAVACATGGTLAGIANALAPGRSVMGIAVLDGEKFLARDIGTLLAQLGGDRRNWSVDHAFHCGGYARTSAALLDFIRQFEGRHGIALEPIYTGKLMYALYQRVAEGHFAPGTHIVAVHTGGLQGLRGRPGGFASAIETVY